MARGKKKEELSLEEKLERALVPVEEQPYEVPGNWCWVTIGTIASVKGGKRVPKGKQLVEYKTEHPYIRVTDFDNHSIAIERVKYIDEETFKLIHKYSISIHDIYISIAGTIGKVGMIPDDLDGANLTENAAKITNIKMVNKNFLLWLLESEVAQSQMRDSTISTTQPKLALFRIENVKFPLPPLEEQQRIVERIESLFAKLDEVGEKIQEVVIGCEFRQASVLKNVFNGKLSESWRAENGIDSDSWNNFIFDDCIDRMQNGLAKRSGQEGKLFGVLRLANLEENGFNTDDLREIRLTKKEQENYKLNVNDIVMIRVNGSRDNVGRQLLVDEEHDWAFCDHIIRIVLKKNIEAAFMILFSKTDTYRHYIEKHMVSSAGQNTISRKGLAELYVPVPTIEEQLYLIKVVNEMIQKDTIMMENAKNVQKKIELMKKSILAKAFRGELGTNELDEESSVELLKKILEETGEDTDVKV